MLNLLCSERALFMQEYLEMTLQTKELGAERCLAFGFSDIVFPARSGHVLAAAGQSGQVCPFGPQDFIRFGVGLLSQRPTMPAAAPCLKCFLNAAMNMASILHTCTALQDLVF